MGRGRTRNPRVQFDDGDATHRAHANVVAGCVDERDVGRDAAREDVELDHDVLRALRRSAKQRARAERRAVIGCALVLHDVCADIGIETAKETLKPQRRTMRMMV